MEANVSEELVQELQKPVIKKYKRRRVYGRFKDNLWAADLAEIGRLSSKNRNVRYLLCVIDVYMCILCFHQICLRQTFKR